MGNTMTLSTEGEFFKSIILTQYKFTICFVWKEVFELVSCDLILLVLFICENSIKISWFSEWVSEYER